MSNKNKLILEEAVFHLFLINWTGAASKFLAQHIMDTNTLWTWADCVFNTWLENIRNYAFNH